MNQYLVLSIVLLALVTLIYINRSAFLSRNSRNNVQFSPTNPEPFITTTTQPSPTIFTTPTSQPQQNDLLLSEFRYPNSQQISNDKNLTLNSTDNPQVITDWYKSEITSKGFTTTSFIQTNTNGEVLNKLVGSNGNKEVRVEISKENSNNEVVIKVESNG